MATMSSETADLAYKFSTIFFYRMDFSCEFGCLLENHDDRFRPTAIAVSPDELPERLIGAVRIAHAELSSAVVADLGDHPSEE
ncbi:hypothetical protein GW17_00010053 [Ensete ventricosum]|nr:hypothetical protein GW17_00010053 [Ensete ventricosum]